MKKSQLQVLKLINLIKYQNQLKINIQSQMINQITCNSNNAIELSRGELLNWLNSLLKLNYSKIEQLGTGAAYCQLLDFIYPGKVPLSKVNWKAKFDYEYLNNFKVLQQSFTKLNIMKHIDVEKLVKCKYQDNLQFLQWFKKIFDTTGSNVKDYDAITRRGDKIQKQKQNKNPVPLLSPHFSSMEAQNSKQASYISSNETSKQSTERAMQSNLKQSLPEPEQPREKSAYKQIQTISPTKLRTYNPSNERVDEKLVQMFTQSQQQEKQFYLRKLKEIQFLMDSWDQSRTSSQLIDNIRKIILATPEVQWTIDEGEYMQN